MKRTSIALAVAALALSAPRPALAKPPPSGYLVVKGGGYFPMGPDISGYDTGPLVEAALGYAPDPGFAFELAGGGFRTSHTLGGGEVRKLQVIPVTFAIRGKVPLQNFEPYAILGTGAYFVHDELGASKDDATNFGFFLGVGGNVNLGRHLFLGLEGRYLYLRTNTFNTETRLDGLTLTADLGFRF